MVKSPGSGRLNNLNDPVLNVLNVLPLLACLLWDRRDVTLTHPLKASWPSYQPAVLVTT